MCIVLDNEQYAVARLQSVAIVGYALRVTIRGVTITGGLDIESIGACAGTPEWPSVHLRQVKRERAAGSCRTTQLNLAAKQACQFTTDCETEAGPTIFPARACIRLLERFKNDALFFSRDADAGIRHLESDDSFGSAQDGMVRSPASLRFSKTDKRTCPCSVNLKAFEGDS